MLYLKIFYNLLTNIIGTMKKNIKIKIFIKKKYFYDLYVYNNK